MRITEVNLIVVFGVKESTDAIREAIEGFAETTHEKLDEPLYEAVNQVVKKVLANAKKFQLEMKNKTTPQYDFNINVAFKAVER